MMDTQRKERSDKGKPRVDHSGKDRHWSFSFNTILEPDIVRQVDDLIAEHGSLKAAIRYLLTGETVVNYGYSDNKLDAILRAIEGLQVNGGKPAKKARRQVDDVEQEYVSNLSELFN